MMTYQVDARFPLMEKEDIDKELNVIGDALDAIGSELIRADLSMDHNYLAIYICTESALIANDILEASDFTIEQIAYLKPRQIAHIKFLTFLSQHYPAYAKPWRLVKRLNQFLLG